MIIELAGPGEAQAKVGDQIRVRLADPTTGHQWEVIDRPDGLTLDSSEFEAGAPGGGDRVLVFTATAPGHHQLTLQRRRAWEPAAAETVTFDVTVT